MGNTELQKLYKIDAWLYKSTEQARQTWRGIFAQKLLLKLTLGFVTHLLVCETWDGVTLVADPARIRARARAKAASVADTPSSA